MLPGDLEGGRKFELFPRGSLDVFSSVYAAFMLITWPVIWVVSARRTISSRDLFEFGHPSRGDVRNSPLEWPERHG